MSAYMDRILIERALGYTLGVRLLVANEFTPWLI